MKRWIHSVVAAVMLVLMCMPTSAQPAGEELAPETQAPERAEGDDSPLRFDPQDVDFASDFYSLNFIGLADKLWNLQLFTAAGTPITVSSITIALIVLLIGLYLAKRVSNLARRRLQGFPRIETTLAAALSKILFYLLAVVVTLIALPIAGIPITIFTLMGGAVAIGIGFGVQNLFNNLISSLIIMIERPIRLGDIVVVDGHEGSIEDIGNRCTRLRRTDGIDVLVPNSYFLEQPVINWTLLDNNVRGKVSVGVAYGSDVRLVERLIYQAMKEQPDIRDDPKPTVLFTEFGDNALLFEVWFWEDIKRPLQLREAESELRFAIDKLFREHHISIAFPQRDLHLDTLRPLQVELMGQSRAS